MLLPGERVVAGISGGADSVCLLFVLLNWREKYGLELEVVHVNHGIRLKADEDAMFVENLCKRFDIPFYLKCADIPKLAKEHKCSEEEAGRNFRYQVFEEVAEETGATKIAVAHNQNDLAETMLFNLFRGSGLKGLTGIAPVRGKIIRPLLCVQRPEIEAYLSQIGQNYCHDVTNEGDDYTRNRIRHHILDYARMNIAPGCVQSMGQTAEILAETEDYLKGQTKDAIEKCVAEKQGRYELDCNSFGKLHPAIQKRLLFKLLGCMAGAKDLARVHVDLLYELCITEGNRQLNLPRGIMARREYETIYLHQESVNDNLSNPLENIQVVFQVLDASDLPRNREKTLIFPQNQYTKWFDYDKIEKSPVIRTREIGDYLTIRDGQGKLCHKKIKDYMVTAKIPARERNNVPLLAIDSHVLWLLGYRISEYYKVNENTKRILQVQLISDNKSDYTEEENDGTY